MVRRLRERLTERGLGCLGQQWLTVGLWLSNGVTYQALQRGTVENTNGLLRRFFSKGMDLGQVTPAQVQRVESLLNHRPRKCLGYRTSYEVLRE
jgi:IS30 family transposase